MIKYGIEFEFFVKDKDTDKIVPACKATNNLDGCPIIGELKTDIHNSLVDCVFDLKKLIFTEQQNLNEKGFSMEIIPMIKLDKEVLIDLRKNRNYIDNKNLEILDAKSIYNKGIGKILPRCVYKSSLQINLSNNKTFNYEIYNKIEIEDKIKWNKEWKDKTYSEIFDYVSIIFNLDNYFQKEIQDTNRVKGVYAIKDGDFGKRIEYRSLPNNISLDKLCKFKN